MYDMNFQNKVYIVTGSASGIGKSAAEKLLESEATVIGIDKQKSSIENSRYHHYMASITDEAKIKSIVNEVVEKFGRIDILINNAGTGAVAPAEDITDEQFENEINIDLFGSFKVARAVAKKAMIPAGYGRVINIASMYGLVGNKIAGSAPYHAAKGGVVNLTRALAAEWGKYGITVNSICPGYFYTPLTKETLDSDFFQKNAKTMIPMERYGNEGELDSAAIFLSSPASSYVTGVMLPVDGGYTCM